MSVISADSHVVEGPEVFAGLADRFGDEAPRVMAVGDEADCIVVPARGAQGVSVARMCLASTRLKRDEPLGRKAGHKPDVANMDDPEIAELFRRGYAAMRPGLVDGSRRGEDQDIDGLAAEFLYPGYFAMFNLPNTGLLVALQRNYNDWLHDHCAASGGRLYGLAAIPVQSPEAAATELERVIGLGYRGGLIPCTSPAEAPYQDPVYEPVWALAEEAGFPLSMHVGCNAYVPPELRSRPLRRDGITQYAGAQAAVQQTLVELMIRGVCERHPDLKFVVAEFNAGWIAHWLDRLDQGLQRELRNTGEARAGPSPHEIWRRQFYATIEDDRPALLTRTLIGVDNLMWGSDYPHTDSTWPCSQSVLDELFADVDAVDRRRITETNVRDLYQLA
jgi:predicted TIM-barrel fold metal-dependent hydrolase